MEAMQDFSKKKEEKKTSQKYRSIKNSLVQGCLSDEGRLQLLKLQHTILIILFSLFRDQ